MSELPERATTDVGGHGAWGRILRRFAPAESGTRAPWLRALGFVALFAAYAPLLHDIVQNGDAAVYNEKVRDHVLGDYVIHVGYVALGMLFHAVLPLRVDLAMNVMALTFGIGAAAALYATATLWGSRLAGLASVLFLLCSATYVRAMVLSEVDILSAALVIFSFAAFARGRPIVSGLIFGLGMLSTPVTLSMIPLFAFTFPIDERGWPVTVRRQAKRVLLFGLAGLALYLPWVALHFQEYFYGGRGVFHSPYARFNLAQQVARGASFFKEDAWGLVPIYLAGLLGSLVDRARWCRDQIAIGVVLSVIATATLVDRASDVPVHLPTLAFLALGAALLLDRAAKATPAVWAVPCFAFLVMGVPAYRAAHAEVEEDRVFRDTSVAMRAQSAPLTAMLVDMPHGWSQHVFFQHYANGSRDLTLTPSLAEFRHRLRELASGPTEYVIYFEHHIPKDIEHALQARYESSERIVNGDRYFVLVPRAH